MMNDEQYNALLQDLHPSRVSTRKGTGKALSYVEAWDVKRTLIRIFGFGGFSADVIDNEFRYETVHTRSDKELWEVAYQATVRLRIHDLGCTYTESAVGSSMGSRAEAHDNAIKNAASDALKRAAIYLGTQFGLSLYNDGSTRDVVRKTLTRDYADDEPSLLPTEVVEKWIDDFAKAKDRPQLALVWTRCRDAGVANVPYMESGRSLLDDLNQRLAEIDAVEES